jgi:hypothetical protein
MSLSSQYTSIYLLIFCATHFSLLLNIIFYPFFTSTFKSEQSECKFVRRGTSLSKDTIYHAPRDRGNIDFSEQLKVR